MTDPTPTASVDRTTDTLLHMFTNDYERVIAHDVNEVPAMYEKWTGVPEDEQDSWRQCPDDEDVGLILVDEPMDSFEALPSSWPADFRITEWKHPHYKDMTRPQVWATVRQWCDHIGEPQLFSSTEW